MNLVLVELRNRLVIHVSQTIRTTSKTTFRQSLPSPSDIKFIVSRRSQVSPKTTCRSKPLVNTSMSYTLVIIIVTQSQCSTVLTRRGWTEVYGRSQCPQRPSYSRRYLRFHTDVETPGERRETSTSGDPCPLNLLESLSREHENTKLVKKGYIQEFNGCVEHFTSRNPR